MTMGPSPRLEWDKASSSACDHLFYAHGAVQNLLGTKPCNYTEVVFVTSIGTLTSMTACCSICSTVVPESSKCEQLYTITICLHFTSVSCWRRIRNLTHQTSLCGQIKHLFYGELYTSLIPRPTPTFHCLQYEQQATGSWLGLVSSPDPWLGTRDYLGPVNQASKSY